MADVIDKLYEGTATDADVHAALGWKIIPHRSWSGRIAKVAPGEPVQGVSRVTRDADCALFLFDDSKVDEAVRAAMALNAPFTRTKTSRGTDIFCRRLCVIALMRTDLRSTYACPERAR